ncbi:MAG: C-type lectin domain-containing protein [Clostridia bacterium]|nr:C-type lectin domain-containing protein [Clostridia bacterium]
MKKTFKKSIAVLMTAMIMLSCWVWYAPTEASASANVPSDAVEYNGHWYKVYEICLTWENAKKYCDDLGGHLVTISSKEENDFVLSILKKSSKAANFIIGLAELKKEGEWSWVTGEPLNYTNWARLQPDNGAGSRSQSYGSMVNGATQYGFKAGQWDDIATASNSEGCHFICEWDVGGKKFPDGYDFLLDKYSFTNPSHVVESKFYRTAYGTVKGSLLSARYENGKPHGLCYGMAATTAALLEHRGAINSFSLLSPDMNLGNAEYISNIFEDAYSDILNMDTISFLKYGYIYQFASDRDATLNDLYGLYSAVKSYIEGNGYGVVISIWHGGKNNRKNGHAVLATGIEETSNEIIILIDDSNFISQTELRINKDFSSWSYIVDGAVLSNGTPYNYNSENGTIGYDIPGNSVYFLGLFAGDKTKLNATYLRENQLLVSSTSSLVDNKNLEEVYFTDELDDTKSETSKIYWSESYINNLELSPTDNDTQITVSDINSSISVTLNSNEKASFYVNDNAYNKICYSSQREDHVNTAFSFSDVDSEIIGVSISGTASSDTVTAAQTDTGLLVTGISDGTVTLTKDDEVIATEEIKDAVGDIEITYDKEGESEELDADYHTHSYESAETKASTCKDEGTVTYTCSCGDTYTEEIEINPENHIGETEVRNVVNSTCTGNGYTGDTYCLDCGEKITEGKVTDIKGHKDADRNYSCDECGATLENNCSHICHKTGFMGFIWKILRIFFKLFKVQPVCSCGIAHY